MIVGHEGATVTCVVTEFAMKHWSWARWCIRSNVAASGSAPTKTIRGERMTVVIAIRPASFLAITPAPPPNTRVSHCTEGLEEADHERPDS